MKSIFHSSSTNTVSTSYQSSNGKTNKYTNTAKKSAKSGSKSMARINALSYMQRLALARTPAQTSNVIRSARLDAQTLKSSGASESEIQAAESLAKKVSKKGNLKISRLKKEMLLEQQRKQALASKQIREAANIYKNLNAKRKCRKAEEESDVLHALPMRKNEDSPIGNGYYNTETHINVMVDSYDFPISADGIDLEI